MDSKVDENISFSLIYDEKDISFKANWPECKNDEEENRMASQFAKLIALTMKPEIIPFIQGFVANKGMKDSRMKFSELVLTYIFKNVVDLGVKNNKNENLSPMISPINAFKVRG